MIFIVIGLVSVGFVALSLRLFRTALGVSGAEGWLGLAFLCVGISMPVRAVLRIGSFFSTESEPMVLLASHALMAAGLSAFTLFVDRVFRPDDGWARLATTLLIGLQIISLPALVFFGGHRDEQNAAVMVVGLIRGLPFGWGFFESYRYYRQMKKRAALGLSDPVTTNRFALFAVWSGALFALPLLLFGLRMWAMLTTETGRLIGDQAGAGLATGILVAGLLGLGGAAIVSLVLSFYPPRIWIERLERRYAPSPG